MDARSRTIGALLVALTVAVSACNALFGIQEGTLADVDAGVDATTEAGDGPSVDAGADQATACSPGEICTPAVCQIGVTSCDDGGAVRCTTLAAATPGTTCDLDGGADGGTGVCAGGTCVGCTPGADCSEAGSCQAASIACASGTPVCTPGGHAPNGMPCGANLFCDNGACQACTAGASCVPAGAPCHTGTASCTDGGLACTDTNNSATDGTSCGVNEVCSGGACVACTAGVTCTPAGASCQSGTTSCSTGQQTCTGVANVKDGTPCGTGMVCSGGTCTACTTSAPCAPGGNACLIGTTDCSSGKATCTQTGVATDGTSCGNGQVCHGGQCGACVANQACNPGGNVCQTGTTSCSTGVPVCNGATSVKDTTPCGTNEVCCGGTCASCSNPLNATAACSGTTCTFTCPSGQHACGSPSACVNDDVNACGSQCLSCPTPAHGAPTCDGTSCGGSCTTSPYLKYCPASSSCVDTTSDTSNCGNCGNACASGATCQSGTCVTCTNQCSTPGTTCQGNTPVTCATGPNGCLVLTTGTACSGSKPNCTNGACTGPCTGAAGQCASGYCCNSGTCVANAPATCGKNGGFCTDCQGSLGGTACVNGACGCSSASDCSATLSVGSHCFIPGNVCGCASNGDCTSELRGSVCSASASDNCGCNTAADCASSGLTPGGCCAQVCVEQGTSGTGGLCDNGSYVPPAAGVPCQGNCGANLCCDMRASPNYPGSCIAAPASSCPSGVCGQPGQSCCPLFGGSQCAAGSSCVNGFCQ